MKKTKTGLELIAEERERQVSKEGFTKDHDDHHIAGEMALAATCYAKEAVWNQFGNMAPHSAVEFNNWPWDNSWWKPSAGPVRNLAKAGALIAAEIDRIQRRDVRRDAFNKKQGGE